MKKSKFKTILGNIINDGKQIQVGIDDIQSCAIDQMSASLQHMQDVLKPIFRYISRIRKITEFIFMILQNTQYDDLRIGLRQFFILSYSQLLSQNSENIKSQLLKQLYEGYQNINIELFKYYQINMINVVLQQSDESVFKLINCLSPYQISVFLTKIGRFQSGLYSIIDVENFRALSFYSLGKFVKELSCDMNNDDVSKQEWNQVLFQGFSDVHYLFLNVHFISQELCIARNGQTGDIVNLDLRSLNYSQKNQQIATFDIFIHQSAGLNNQISIPEQCRAVCCVGVANMNFMNPTQLNTLHLSNCQFVDLSRCEKLQLITLQNIQNVNLTFLRNIQALKSVFIENIMTSEGYNQNNVVQEVLDNVNQNLTILHIRKCNSALIVVLNKCLPRLKFLQLRENAQLIVCNIYVVKASKNSLQSLQYIDSDINLYFNGQSYPLLHLFNISSRNQVDTEKLRTGNFEKSNLESFPEVLWQAIEIVNEDKEKGVSDVLKALLYFYIKSESVIEKFNAHEVVRHILSQENQQFQEVKHLMSYFESPNAFSNALIAQLQHKYIITINDMLVKKYIGKVTDVLSFQNNNIPYANEAQQQQFISCLFDNIAKQVYIKINYQFDDQMIFLQDRNTRQFIPLHKVNRQQTYNAIAYLDSQDLTLDLNLECLCVYNRIGSYSNIYFINSTQMQQLVSLSLSWCNCPNLSYANQIKTLSLVCVNNVDIAFINQCDNLEIFYVLKIVLTDESIENGTQILNALYNKTMLKKLYMRYCYCQDVVQLSFQSTQLAVIHLERNFNLRSLVISPNFRSIKTLNYIFLEPRYKTDKLFLSIPDIYFPNLQFIHCHNVFNIRRHLEHLRYGSDYFV